MKIHHIAIWTNDLERLRGFYITYFGSSCNTKYRNESKMFESYFLSFGEGTQIEIMQKSGIPHNANDPVLQAIGLSHIAIEVGSRQKVDELTERLRYDGHIIVSEPRQSGDGYFESCILDPDGNKLEILSV